MMRNTWMQDNHPIMVGLMAASPDGEGFNARVEGYENMSLSNGINRCLIGQADITLTTHNIHDSAF